jgi:hypothetical protein
MKQGAKQEIQTEVMGNEVVDDDLACKAEEKQKKVCAYSQQANEALRGNQGRRMTDPLFLHLSLYDPDTGYIEIHWMASFSPKVLMICMPYSMPEHLTRIMELILKEDKNFKKNGVETIAALICDFEMHIGYDVAEGKKWFENRLGQ